MKCKVWLFIMGDIFSFYSCLYVFSVRLISNKSKTAFGPSYIPLESKSWNRYFHYIVIKKTYFWKCNTIFWKSMKFSIFLSTHILIFINELWRKIECKKNTSSSHSHRHDFIIVMKKSFSTFSSSYSCFLGKAITYSDRAWNSLSSYIFTYCLRLNYWGGNLNTTNTSLTDK